MTNPMTDAEMLAKLRYIVDQVEAEFSDDLGLNEIIDSLRVRV